MGINIRFYHQKRKKKKGLPSDQILAKVEVSYNTKSTHFSRKIVLTFYQGQSQTFNQRGQKFEEKNPEIPN